MADTVTGPTILQQNDKRVVIKIHLKWGTAANEPLVMSFEGDGVRFETAAFVDVTNCDFVVAYYN